MGDTNIQWAKKVWNPFGGCTKVSAGCANCYAGRLAEWRLQRFYPDGFWNGVYFFRHRLEEPLKWRKPAVVFVGSMGDLFHPSMPDSYIDKIFAVMAKALKHTFMILTKRTERMLKYLENNYPDNPLPNVWVGASIENQETADVRIPLLLQVPAAKRFVSYEPALGSVNFHLGNSRSDIIWRRMNGGAYERRNIDLVIMGGESGDNARPIHPDWARSTRDQCKAAGVSFFFKQWGEYYPVDDDPTDWADGEIPLNSDGTDCGGVEALIDDTCVKMKKVGKKKAGHLLDGVQHHEWPE